MRILVVEDERLLRLQLKEELERQASSRGKHEIHVADSYEAAREILQRQMVDIAFVDLNLGPGHDKAGIKLLQQVRSELPHIVTIIMTGIEDSAVVEECLRLGAADYIFKPFEPRIVHHLMIKAVVHHRLFRKNQTLKAQGGDRVVEPIVLSTKSPPFKAVLEQAKKLRGKNLRVLITGESGTGKEVMAQYLWSLEKDPDRPFIPVHCGAISENLVESALFGHVKGAFTGATEDKKGYFEAADGGDIFLDEVATMPQSVQVKLLRTLNSGEVVRVGGNKGKKFDFRVIAATNEKLSELTEKKLFRDDLLFRLTEVELKLPPLRERLEDLPDLIEAFLRKAGHPDKSLSKGALRLVEKYPWPGNIRQLEKVITVLAEFTSKNAIEENDLQNQLIPSAPKKATKESQNLFQLIPEQCMGRFQMNVDQLEQAMARYALDNTENDSQAAKLLGIPRNSLIRRIQEWGWKQ